MTLPSNYTDDNEHNRRDESDDAGINKAIKPTLKPKSENGLIGIAVISWIIIIAASSYNTTVGFIFAIIFALILVGLGQYSNNGKINMLLTIAAFIGFCIPILMLWHEHAVWLDNFHHKYADLESRYK